MSNLSELFHKSKTLEPDSIEELYIKELEQQRAELIELIERICVSNGIKFNNVMDDFYAKKKVLK